jgi:uncharacterized protein with HEPN domain
MVYIEDILEAITKIEEYMKELKSDEEFYNNAQIQDAVLRRLEIIGEAVKNIPEEFRSQYPEIPLETNCRYAGYPHSRIFRRKAKASPEGRKRRLS